VGLKDLLNKGKCLVGLHQGEWRAASARECTFTRICDLCHIESRKVEHIWPEWSFTAQDSCDQARVCTRCASSETRVDHSWGPVAYVATDSCNRKQTCSRCKATIPGEPLHVLDSWKYTEADKCNQLQACSRCHYVGTTYRVEHSWAEWEHSNAHNALVRVCGRCGDLQVQPAPSATPQREASSSAAGTARLAEMSRKEMFEALKGKMQTLADQTSAMDRVLGAMTDSVKERLAGADVAEEVEKPKRDTRLVGHWLYDDILPGGGMSTQIHLFLADDGSFRRYSQSWGPAGEIRSPEERGEWHDERRPGPSDPANRNLVLSYDDDQESRNQYEFVRGELFFPGSKWSRTWSRGR
jgi:hypothetical protein